MSNFVWIIPSERLASLGNGGISPSYIIPLGQMNGHEGRLRGSRLWILLRGADDRCIAVATIKRVERFRDDYYANDFLVSCDTTASFRLSSTFEDAKPFSVSDFREHGLGTHLASSGAAEKLKVLVSRSVQIKLASPSDATLTGVRIDLPSKNVQRLAKFALSQVTQALPLDRVWASGTGEKRGPFSNFASRLLSLRGYDALQASSFLKANDPVTLLAEAASSVAVSKKANSARSFEKSVDLDFTEIDPETIYAREFVVSEGYLPDLESALSKTEAAEKLHQSMLRDISSYLKANGVSPFESASVDLMIILDHQRRIFEIKSSTLANIMAQAAKGAFQIACYLNAMAADYEQLDGFLILHKVEDSNFEVFVRDALTRLGVKNLTYDPSKKWPERVSGLLD
jgi:hypothetical protein